MLLSVTTQISNGSTEMRANALVTLKKHPIVYQGFSIPAMFDQSNVVH